MEKIHEIYHKVSELFRKFGVKSVTMDDISGELGISKKTLYLYVADKTDLINKLVDYEIDVAQRCVAGIFRSGLNAIEELFEVNRFMVGMMKRYSPSFYYDMKKYYPDVFCKIQDIRRINIYNATLNNLRKGKTEGLFRHELNEEVLAKLHLSRMEDIYNNSLFSSDELNSGYVFKEFFIYHIRGIANEKGIKFLEENIHKLEYVEKDIFESEKNSG
jgi:AcrR family transcriptional regulator